MVEYIDLVSMAGITANAGIDLGIPDAVRAEALAYLVVVLEGHHADRVEEDCGALAAQLDELGALEVYVLPDHAGHDLIAAREHAFWASKAAGADDIVDVVVPRASIPTFLASVSTLAAESGSLVVGCGHAGDGNVHLSVFQPEPAGRRRLVHDIVAAGVALGGAVSGEHGIGTAKLESFSDLEDPVKLDLMRRIKSAFDPMGILNPGTIFTTRPHAKEPVRERCPVPHPHPRRPRRRHLLHEPGYLRDALRRRPRRRARHARRPDALRRRGHRRGRRVRPDRRQARHHPAPSRSRPRQRPGQPPQRPTGPQPGGQHRGRPRPDPQALRRPAGVGHRDRRPQRVHLRPASESTPDLGRRRRRHGRRRLRASRLRRHADPARRRLVDEGGPSPGHLHAAATPAPLPIGRSSRPRHGPCVPASARRCSSADGPAADRSSRPSPTWPRPPGANCSARRSPPPGARGRPAGRRTARLPGRVRHHAVGRPPPPRPGRRQVAGVVLRLPRKAERPGTRRVRRPPRRRSGRRRGRRRGRPLRSRRRDGLRRPTPAASPRPADRCADRPDGVPGSRRTAPGGGDRVRRGEHRGPVRPGRHGRFTGPRLALPHRRRHRTGTAAGRRSARSPLPGAASSPSRPTAARSTPSRRCGPWPARASTSRRSS